MIYKLKYLKICCWMRCCSSACLY